VRERGQARGADQPSRRRLKLPRVVSQVPFWILLAIVGVCTVKVLALSTDPKLVTLGKSPVTATYLRSSDVYRKAVHKLLNGSITNRSKLTINADGVAHTLQREFPELQTVSVTVPLVGNRPIVYIQIAKPAMVLQTARGIYAVNGSGVVLSALRELPPDVPVVADQSAAVPQVGRQAIPGSTVHFVQAVAYQLKAADIAINTFVSSVKTPYELDVRLEGRPFVVKYNLQGDAVEQSGTVVAALQHLEDATPSEYLDVRTPGRVFYK